jgi:hypothetical protein
MDTRGLYRVRKSFGQKHTKEWGKPIVFLKHQQRRMKKMSVCVAGRRESCRKKKQSDRTPHSL